MENTINQIEAERIMLAKILTLIDQHERKQRHFMREFDKFMEEIDNNLEEIQEQNERD